MKKMHATINATLRLAGVVLASLILCNITLAQQPPDNVQGDWTIYSTRIQDGQIEVKHIQIAQYGNRITGYFQGPNQSGPIQGEINVHHIRFSTVTRNVLTFMGQIYGDNMSGTYGLHGKHAPWQAQRIPPIAQAVPPAPAINYQPVLTPVSAPEPQVAPQQVADSAGQDGSTVQDSPNPGPTPALLTSDQLDALVAPIALYPDALVAQVLAAATNPDQITYADDWLAQNRNLTGTALGQAVNEQSWDPSVKALTQFSSVLDNLAHNLSWTSSLGQAFANQQSDVMGAVQAMRAKAQAAGTLQSNSQITVTQPASTTIVIQPANPQVVYVPQYNPAVVYGAAVVVPMYVAPPLPVTSFGLYFGSGITIGATFGGGGWGGGFGWGWHSWNVNWGGGWGGGGGSTIIYNHTTYINNHTWNNTNYNGYHPWANNSGYHPGADTHYGPNGDYHPNGYYGPNGDFHHDVPGTNPHDQPNGGHNGDHGLIGGNGGVQHPSGTQPHADGSSWGDRGPNGGHNGDHGLIGGNGGVQHPSGTQPHADGSSWGDRGPNGGHNGDHGMIGGNGGVQHASTAPNNGGQMLGQNRSGYTHPMGTDQNRSRLSGNGSANRMESNRGRDSMAARHPQQHMARMHAPAVGRSGGGGRRR
ncbi:MAG: DUF3300 domain-containing protein [Terriglobales bacterium]|jgi:hypothetical protein